LDTPGPDSSIFFGEPERTNSGSLAKRHQKHNISKSHTFPGVNSKNLLHFKKIKKEAPKARNKTIYIPVKICVQITF
jgi:hypothetical protein